MSHSPNQSNLHQWEIQTHTTSIGIFAFPMVVMYQDDITSLSDDCQGLHTVLDCRRFWRTVMAANMCVVVSRECTQNKPKPKETVTPTIHLLPI